MIHQYKLNGYNIVLDVYSGSVHLVDDVAYDCIALFESTPRDQIIAQMMEKHGHLDGVDETELAACLDDIQAFLPGPLAGRGAGGVRARQARPQGHVPARGTHLQLKLPVLLRQPGPVPW